MRRDVRRRGVCQDRQSQGPRASPSAIARSRAAVYEKAGFEKYAAGNKALAVAVEVTSAVDRAREAVRRYKQTQHVAELKPEPPASVRCCSRIAVIGAR
jgi:hypothetical protein